MFIELRADTIRGFQSTLINCTFRCFHIVLYYMMNQLSILLLVRAQQHQCALRCLAPNLKRFSLTLCSLSASVYVQIVCWYQ